MPAKKKNIVKESQPKAVKLNTDVDLNTIGKQTIEIANDAPAIKKKDVNAENKKTTEFMQPGEDGGVIKKIDILQPTLTEAEVMKIGIAKWHKFKGREDIYTTVINGRRFKLPKPLFMRLKDKGLVIQDG